MQNLPALNWFPPGGFTTPEDIARVALRWRDDPASPPQLVRLFFDVDGVPLCPGSGKRVPRARWVSYFGPKIAELAEAFYFACDRCGKTQRLRQLASHAVEAKLDAMRRAA
jgi:hypothetical protein